jgi:hypothetical protein
MFSGLSKTTLKNSGNFVKKSESGIKESEEKSFDTKPNKNDNRNFIIIESLK